MTSTTVTNRLLLSLSKADRRLLATGLERVDLELRRPIEEANTPIKHVYFPDHGIISVVVKSAGLEIEAGLVGREGMSGTAVVLGDDRSPNDAYVQIAGGAHRITTRRLRAALEASKTMRQIMQRYVHVFMVQVAQTAFANGKANIEDRLARWLLMAHDRQDDDELQLTHEFLSVMLGVRRSGVTEALQELESKGLVRASRGVIRVVDRRKLLKAAGSAYGVPEAEYKRLLS